MDYGRIIKRAWSVTWRYRVLWIFGLFVGGATGGGGGGGGGGGSNTNYQSSPQDIEQLRSVYNDAVGYFEQYLVLIIVLVALATFVGIAMWIVSVAARGGLIHLVNEAEEGRAVKASDGWAAGFRNWGRIFAIDLILYLPFTVILLLVLGFTVVPLVLATVNGGDVGAGVFGLCGGSVVMFILVFVFGFVLGLLELMATRHAVLDPLPATRSLALAWAELRGRFKDLLVMWLISLAVGLGYGVAVGIIAAVFAIAIGIAAIGGLWPVVAGIAFLMFLVLLVPGAIFGTFSSALWTVFFRQLTGRDVPVPAQVTPTAELVPPAPPAPPAAPYVPTAPAE